MKKRLLAMLLALIMVMGALPMAAFADDTVTDIAENNVVAEKDGVTVVLANYNLAGRKPWDSASLKIESVEPGSGDINKVVNLTLTVANLTSHTNASGNPGEWIGIGVPANDETGTDENAPAYYTDLGDYTASGYESKGYAVNGANPVNGYVASGYLASQKVPVDGTTYACRYWNLANLTEADNSTGFIVKRIKDGDGFKYDIYNVTFKSEAPIVVAAPIADHPNAPGDPDTGVVTEGLGTVAVDITGSAYRTYDVTLTGTDIVVHKNAQGNDGTWVGFGMPITNSTGAGYSYYQKAEDGTLGDPINSVPGRVHEDNGKYYNTIYFKADGTYTIVQKLDGNTIATYIVAVSISEKNDENTTLPTVPSVGGGDNTSGDTTTETKTNEDGSTTTTVTDNKTGTVTETTEWEDGTVEVVETKKDGTVTETTTDPEGGKVEKVTTPDEDVTITVTDKDGEELAKVEIPAEIPALDEDEKFTDVPDSNFAAEAINEMAALGVVTGMGDGTFNRNGDMKRGDLALMLSRLSNAGEGYELTFSDVRATKYYANGVAWAAKTGVVTGRDDDTFAPEDTITREELALMLYRYAKLLKLDAGTAEDTLDSFPDGSNTHSWAEEGMAWCVANGILQGRTNGNLDPRTNVTRAEVAVMLQRFINLMK